MKRKLKKNRPPRTCRRSSEPDRITTAPHRSPLTNRSSPRHRSPWCRRRFGPWVLAPTCRAVGSRVGSGGRVGSTRNRFAMLKAHGILHAPMLGWYNNIYIYLIISKYRWRQMTSRMVNMCHVSIKAPLRQVRFQSWLLPPRPSNCGWRIMNKQWVGSRVDLAEKNRRQKKDPTNMISFLNASHIAILSFCLILLFRCRAAFIWVLGERPTMGVVSFSFSSCRKQKGMLAHGYLLESQEKRKAHTAKRLARRLEGSRVSFLPSYFIHVWSLELVFVLPFPSTTKSAQVLCLIYPCFGTLLEKNKTKQPGASSVGSGAFSGSGAGASAKVPLRMARRWAERRSAPSRSGDEGAGRANTQLFEIPSNLREERKKDQRVATRWHACRLEALGVSTCFNMMAWFQQTIDDLGDRKLLFNIAPTIAPTVARRSDPSASRCFQTSRRANQGLEKGSMGYIDHGVGGSEHLGW